MVSQSDFSYKVSVLGSKLKWEWEVENSRKGSVPDPCRGQKCPFGADKVVCILWRLMNRLSNRQ